MRNNLLQENDQLLIRNSNLTLEFRIRKRWLIFYNSGPDNTFCSVAVAIVTALSEWLVCHIVKKKGNTHTHTHVLTLVLFLTFCETWCVLCNCVGVFSDLECADVEAFVHTRSRPLCIRLLPLSNRKKKKESITSRYISITIMKSFATKWTFTTCLSKHQTLSLLHLHHLLSLWSLVSKNKPQWTLGWSLARRHGSVPGRTGFPNCAAKPVLQ